MATAAINRQAVVTDLDLDGIDSVLGLHIGTVNTLFVTRLEKRLDPLRITPKQVAMLWLVNANPGVKQTELSKFFQIERPTVHQFVRQLIKNGFLVNEPSKLDRRAGGLSLTDAGREVLAKAQLEIATHEDQLTACLTSREKAELFRVIMKLYLAAPAKD